MADAAFLDIQEVGLSYGGTRALDGVSVRVEEGELVSVVGPNGAGKTSLFRAISGTVAPDAGRVVFDGEDITDLPASRRAHLGIAHVPEGREVFRSLTIQENLEMGAWTRAGQRDFARTEEQVFEMFPRLKERRRQFSGTLSGGEQQMLAIARGLASRPRLMMLDEPSMGLAPAVADMIFDSIERLHSETGLTILLVEQRAAEAMEYCDRGYVLQTGRIMLSGTYAELSKDDRVRQAYLGM